MLCDKGVVTLSLVGSSANKQAICNALNRLDKIETAMADAAEAVTEALAERAKHLPMDFRGRSPIEKRLHEACGKVNELCEDCAKRRTDRP
jgi:hypothetical protein